MRIVMLVRESVHNLLFVQLQLLVLNPLVGSWYGTYTRHLYIYFKLTGIEMNYQTLSSGKPYFL